VKGWTLTVFGTDGLDANVKLLDGDKKFTNLSPHRSQLDGNKKKRQVGTITVD